jgi:hypothetical protein
MMELLVETYCDRRKLYLSWNAASRHISKRLYQRVEEHNASVPDRGGPSIETTPLPSGAQFLDVIESVFSGMARAIIHNSDYRTLEDAKAAIDRHFADRNTHFLRYPRKAGRKIWGKEREPAEFSEANNCKTPVTAKWRCNFGPMAAIGNPHEQMSACYRCALPSRRSGFGQHLPSAPGLNFREARPARPFQGRRGPTRSSPPSPALPAKHAPTPLPVVDRARTALPRAQIDLIVGGRKLRAALIRRASCACRLAFRHGCRRRSVSGSGDRSSTRANSGRFERLPVSTPVYSPTSSRLPRPR